MIADEILSIKRVRSMHELKYDVWPNPNVELDKKRSYMRRTKLRALSSC